MKFGSKINNNFNYCLQKHYYIDNTIMSSWHYFLLKLMRISQLNIKC